MTEQFQESNLKEWGRYGPPVCAEELAALTNKELQWLKRGALLGEKINGHFTRSRWYPFPRDLCFPVEKPLFHKWARHKKNLVEIGVFEGASALTLRQVMSATGTLHLIDPFMEVPDSKLTARPWMTHVNVSRSQNGRVIWYRNYSQIVVQNWSEPIDFLFIDGDHAEKACRRDWMQWHQFVEVGGIVAFHDARFMKNKEQWDGWPGPTKIVDEIFRGPHKLPHWEIVDEAGTLVVVQRQKNGV